MKGVLWLLVIVAISLAGLSEGAVEAEVEVKAEEEESECVWV